MKKLLENINNTNKNYLYPFFWQHGESNDVLESYVDKIYDAGIRSFCIESRHYKGFLSEEWWRSLDCIIQKAKSYDMKIWILDDAKFPTGYANGKVPKHLQKRYINMRRFDVEGPMKQAEISLDKVADLRTLMMNPNISDERIIKILLSENDRNSLEAFKEDTVTDISDCYDEGILRVDIPNGAYSIFVIYETSVGGEQTTDDYLDPTRKEATQILIDEVYEQHYKHYAQEFEKTIVGFFSDEPRFGNVKGMDAIVGKKEMVLPWNKNIEKLFKESYSLSDLLYLFVGENELCKEVRFTYMDIVSSLYSENFTQVIGNWCKEKGIDYTGHLIEDNNAHTRLGYGTGHYFRGIAGQTIAGIDVISAQIVPGMDYIHSGPSVGGNDGEFYHYTLCKLGASAAKLDANKNGLCMCEAFGAYGWVEGLKMMKWISNHLLVNGVNMIVPHAFDPSEYPSWDCPPHFYAHGNNPQYPYFKYLNTYLNRLCNLLSGGYQECNVGVLYNAFAEWSSKAMPVQKVIKQLSQNQIDCNIISEDYLMDSTLKDNQYYINNYGYQVLIIPFAEKLPIFLLDKIKEIAKAVEVIFIDSFPKNFVDDNAKVVNLNEVASQLDYVKEVNLTTKENSLSYYHYVQQDGDVYIFNNESISKTIDTKLTLNTIQPLMIYDASNNKTYNLESKVNDYETVFNLHLKPYEMQVIVTGTSKNQVIKKGNRALTINQGFDIYMKNYNEKQYEKKYKNTKLLNLGKLHPRFSGNIKYISSFKCDDSNVLLEIDDVYEIVEVFVNGQLCGIKLTPDYIFDISEACRKGKNTLEIIVTNNLERNQRDGFSQYLPLEALGILGEINLYTKE